MKYQAVELLFYDLAGWNAFFALQYRGWVIAAFLVS